jgi:hypothetical protein
LQSTNYNNIKIWLFRMLDIYKHMDLNFCKLPIHMQFRRR